MTRRTRNILLAGIGGVLLLILATVFVVPRTAWFRDWLRDLVASRASAAINGSVTLERITGSLLHDVTLHGLAVQQAGTTVVEARAIEASYDPWQLARGHLQIDRVKLVNPVVRLVRDEQGWNLARLVRTDNAPATAEPRAVLVRRLEIIDGTVSVVDAGARLAALSSLDAEASLGVEPEGTTLNLREASFVDDVSGVPARAEANVVFGRNGLAVDGMRVDAPSVVLEGRVRMPGDPDTLDVDLRLSLNEWMARTVAVYLPEALHQLPALSGEASARGALPALQSEWDLRLSDGGSTGRLTVNAAARRPTVVGRVSVRNLNPAIVTGRREDEGVISLDADIDAAIDVQDPLASDATFAIDGGPFRLQGYRAERIRAQGTLSGRALAASGSLAAYGARTTARVNVAGLGAAASPSMEASGRIVGLDVARLPTGLGMPDITTSISGEYAFRLSGESWSADFAADRSTVGEAVISAGAVVRVQANGSALDAALSADLANVSSALLADKAPSRPTVVAGRIDAALSIPDVKDPLALDTLGAQIVASLAESTVVGVPVEAAELDLSLADGWLSVRRLDVKSQTVSAVAQGSLAVGERAGAPSDLAYQIDVPDLAALPEEWVKGLRGGATVEGRLGGTAQHPAVVGTFNLREPAFQESARALTMTGTFEVAVPDRQLDRVSANLTTEATFVTVGDHELQSAAIAAHYEARRIDLTARIDQEDRSLDVDGGLALFPDYREIHLRQLTLSGLGAPWSLDRTSGEGAVIRYGEDDIQVKGLVFVRDGERIGIEGAAGLPGRPGASDLSVEWSGLSVGDLLTMATGEPNVTGRASGQLHLTGQIDRPDMTASLLVVDGAVASVPFTRAEVDLRLVDRRAEVTGRIDEANGNSITVDGSLPVGDADDAPIDLRLKSTEISLGLLAAATSHVEAIEGTAEVDVHVGGTMAAPALSGTAHVRDGAFTVAPTGVRYHSVFLDTRVDGEMLMIDRASLADPDGNTLTITGGGKVLTRDERTVDVVIRGDDIRVLDNQLGDVALSIDARAEGQLLTPSVAGRIVVNRGRIEVDELLPRLGRPAAPAAEAPVEAVASGAALSSEPATSAESPEEDPEAPVSRASIDLNVELPDNLVLRGRNIRTATGNLGLGNMNLTIGGAFAVRKEPTTPVRLVGAVEVVRGFYEFQGRRFTVERGSDIRFRGTDTINPELNVTGQREVSGITARVQITGTANRPRIALSSDPPLDEGDVLALVIFNQPMSQLGEAQQVDLMGRAGDIALGALATSLADSIGRALDVDLFEIRAPSSTGSGEVAVGTQVSERLFVGFRQEIGAAGASRLSFEYRLTELLRLLTSFGHGTERGRTLRDREAAGVDLVFRVRY